MKKVLFFISVIFIAGCSSAPSSGNNPVDKQQANTTAPNVQTVQNTDVADANAVNQNVNANQNLMPLGRKIQKNLSANSNSNPAEKAKIIFVPAGNNSEIGSTMGDDGEFLEIRVFKSDKLLQKTVRKVTAKKIVVYLKNGKTIEIDESKISQHSSASPEEILIAAGVLQKTDASQTGGK